MTTSSIAPVRFPYPCFEGKAWEEALAESVRVDSLLPGVGGIVVLAAAPHGMVMQGLVLLATAGGAEVGLWSETSGVAETSSASVELDVGAIAANINERWTMRKVGEMGPFDPTRGRVVTLFAAAAGKTAWMRFQSPRGANVDDLDELVASIMNALLE